MLGKAKKVETFGDIRLYECPGSYITPETVEILQAVFLVTETHVPYFPGGWVDQPHWLQEAVTLYKKEIADRMEKEREKGQQTAGK